MEDEERDGPIPPEEHPLIPWETRRRLQEAKLQRFLEEKHQEMVQELGFPWRRARIAIGIAIAALLIYMFRG